MTLRRSLASVIALLMGSLALKPLSVSGQASTQVHTLVNGVQVAVVHFPGSTNVSLFTFLPLGLAHDGPGQTQWAHLIEHLVIRSTVPAEAQWANAETQPDHLRLDTYGDILNWREHLQHHVRWLVGEPFIEPVLEAEKPKVMQECDFTERNLATHKFALAAWNQAVRHQRGHAAIRADVLNAGLAGLQEHRDRHLFVQAQTTVCLVGGIRPEEALPVLTKELGSLSSSATPVAWSEVAVGRTQAVTWDLSTRHLVMTWSIPGPAEDDHAAFVVVGRVLMMRLFADAELKKLTGMTIAGTDLTTPEGTWFHVSASLKPDADMAKVRSQIESHIKALHDDRSALAPVPMLGGQLAFTLNQAIDPKRARAGAPASVTDAMLESNLGLQWATQVHRLGDRREALAARLRALTADQVRASVGAHLKADRASVCEIKPR